jgi:cyclohexyl-isocyanide hydratase
VNERVVRDGSTITGGGVTAGVDFALVVMNEIAGPGVTQTVQLGLEYDPKPPFAGGSPARAPAEIKATVDQRYAPRLPAFEKILDRVAPRLARAG